MRNRLSVIVLLAFCFVQVDLEKSTFAAQKAISDILRGQIAKHSGKIDVVSCGSKQGLSVKIVNKLLRDKTELLSVQLKNCRNATILLNTSTLLVFDSSADFQENFGKITWQTHKDKRFKHLVYIHDGTADDIASSGIENGFDIDQVAFLVNETKKSIDLATSYMFTEEKCRESQLVVINRFDKDTMAWVNDNFYSNKYQNLHMCGVTSVTFRSDQEVLYDRLMNEMSLLMHFKIVKVYAEHESKFRALIASGKQDFYNYITFLEDQTMVQIVISAEKLVFVVPFGKPLTSLEKFLSIFDATTWILTFTTLLLTVVTIQVVSVVSRQLRDLCFGSNVGSPTMNFLNVFLCGGQTNVPKKSNARFIFLIFLLWSLIIRTCFQSLLFRALQMDLRHLPLRTFQDLLDNKFSQYVVSEKALDIDEESLHNIRYE